VVIVDTGHTPHSSSYKKNTPQSLLDFLHDLVTASLETAVDPWMAVVVADIGHLVGSGPVSLSRLLFTELSA
jgi:hypothetical protein